MKSKHTADSAKAGPADLMVGIATLEEDCEKVMQNDSWKTIVMSSILRQDDKCVDFHGPLAEEMLQSLFEILNVPIEGPAWDILLGVVYDLTDDYDGRNNETEFIRKFCYRVFDLNQKVADLESQLGLS